MSDLIEKAASKLDWSDDRSLVERAAEKLEPGPVELAPGADVARPRKPGRDLADRGRQAPHLRPVPAKSSKYATIDLESLRAQGIITPLGPRSRLAEEYRVIKRPLLRKAFATGPDAIHNGNLIMVVSAAPNEGKTFTAISLAMSIASEWDKHVLLVDTDLHNPGIMRRLGMEADLGFVDVLENEDLDLSDVLIRTNIENMVVLPAGRTHELGTELLASARMAQLVEEIAKRYSDRVVIFDTGPALASSEASTLAAHVGQILFVVEAEKTRDSAVKASLDLLSSCRNISLLLNKSRGGGQTGQFGSYYKARGTV